MSDPINVSGQGGNIVIAGVTYSVVRWTIQKQYVNANATTTGSGGWGRVKRILGHWLFVAELLLDLSVTIDSVQAGIPYGIEAGAGAACTFLLGASGKAYSGSAVISQTRPVNAAEDLVRYEIAGDGNGPLNGPA